MSVKVMGAVFDAGGMTPTKKLVLLSLADHANHDGLSIYPSVETICKKTALSEATVRRTLSELRSEKLIFLVGRRGNRQNEYGINLTVLSQRQVSPTTEISQTYHSDTSRPITVIPDPSDESSVEPSDKPNGADKPRSDSQHPAIQAYRLKAKTYPDKAQYDTIIEAVGETQEALEFWGCVVKAYIDLGWNKRNIGNMVGYFKRHEIPALNRNGNGKNASDTRPAWMRGIEKAVQEGENGNA